MKRFARILSAALLLLVRQGLGFALVNASLLLLLCGLAAALWPGG